MTDNTELFCVRYANDKKPLLPKGVIGIIKQNGVVIVKHGLRFLKGNAMLLLIGTVLFFISCKMYVHNYIIHIF